jgi:hypothetical protein
MVTHEEILVVFNPAMQAFQGFAREMSVAWRKLQTCWQRSRCKSADSNKGASHIHSAKFIFMNGNEA